jgi:hypothetical protein
LGANTNLVQIRHDYTLKITYKHKLLPHHFPMLPITIELGMVIAAKPRQVTCFFHDRAMFGTWFQASIKSNTGGDELWVMTFHKSRQEEVNRLCKKAKLLRPLKW